jgi:hypothetical protein
MVEDTTQYSEQSFLRSYYIPKSDESNRQMCFIQGRLMMLPIKKILFPSSFWGIFDFFVLFDDFEKRIKEYYVTMEERVQQTYKLKSKGQY